MKQVFVSGSLAYDHLYTIPQVFQDVIELQKQPLSIAFNVKDRSVHFGGCSGNIAYNARLLEENFRVLGIVGHNFGEYDAWLQKNRIATDLVIRVSNDFTSQATVLTDQKGQQITFFHEGAASRSKEHREELLKHLEQHAEEIAFVHIAPNNHEFMETTLQGCRQFHIPFFFDPGQALPTFSKEELLSILPEAAGVFANEYEHNMLAKKLDIEAQALSSHVRLLITTLGEKGSRITYQGQTMEIPPGKPSVARDPTGCGDAYRAGFLSIIAKTFPNFTAETLEKAGQEGTRLATACLESVGTQNHSL